MNDRSRFPTFAAFHFGNHYSSGLFADTSEHIRLFLFSSLFALFAVGSAR